MLDGLDIDEERKRLKVAKARRLAASTPYPEETATYLARATALERGER